MSIFEQFDKRFDMESLNADLQVIGVSSERKFQEVPIGKYETKLEDISLGMSKSQNLPMVKFKFRIIEGMFNNQIIFINMPVFALVKGTIDQRDDKITSFLISRANEFLRSLKTEVPVKFTSYSEYQKTIDELFDKTTPYGYVLDYSQKDGYKNYKILDSFPL